ncbi:MAG TPA: hypothetical protein ENL35_00630 [Chloroflexi bacterium]|nr:hypothetical protein [Chloroflexota bacterium]
MHAGIIQMAWFRGKQGGKALRTWGVLILPMALALALKWALLQLDVFPFNADEAIVALMARHILQGEKPIFFYGQAYMGSLDAILVALGFRILGEKVQVIRIIQTLLYLGTVGTTIAMARHLLGSARKATFAGLIMALPTVNVTLYSTVSLGGYGEALLMGNLLLLASFSVWDQPARLVGCALWGFLAGLSLWAFALTLIYVIPSGALMLLSLRKAERRSIRLQAFLGAAAGALLGVGPLVAWGFQHGFVPLLQEALGSAIAVGDNGPILQTIGTRLVNLVIFGIPAAIGLRPPWDVKILTAPLAPITMLFWIAAALEGIYLLRTASASRLKLAAVLAMPAVLIVGFLATPFGGDPSGRYFLPLILPLALLGGSFAGAKWRWMKKGPRLGLFAGVLAFQLLSHVVVARQNPPGFTTQFDAVTRIDHRYDGALISFLEERGEYTGYTNYWVAYPLAFLSQERLIYVPWLPYHLDFRYTARYDRYAPYGRAVAMSPTSAYITVHHPDLDAFLRRALSLRGISWQETQIGDYQVFYDLSEKVSPSELGAPWLDLEG